jgi:hypothetical protein
MRKLSLQQAAEPRVAEIVDRCCIEDQDARLSSIALLQEATSTLASPGSPQLPFLHRAILKDGDSPMVDSDALSRLLDSGVDPASEDLQGRTPLHTVAQQRQCHASVVEELIQLLLRKGADHGAKDDVGKTPLMYAAMAGNSAAVLALLENGANAFDKDDAGWTALCYADTYLRLEMMNNLIEKEVGASKMTVQLPGGLPEHSKLLASVTELAWSCHAQGRWEDEEELNTRALEIRRRIPLFGEEHPESVSTYDLTPYIWNEPPIPDFSIPTSGAELRYPSCFSSLDPAQSPAWDIVSHFQESETSSAIMVATPSSNAYTPGSDDMDWERMSDFNSQNARRASSSYTRMGGRPRRRMLGTHVDPKAGTSTLKPPRGACWHCIFQRDRVRPVHVVLRVLLIDSAVRAW